MQNRYMGKGAERKTFCAFFLYENEKSGQVFCRKKEISLQDRKSLKDQLRTGEMELLAVGYPGMQQAARLAAESRDALKGTIPAWMLDEVIRTDERMQERFFRLVGDEISEYSPISSVDLGQTIKSDRKLRMTITDGNMQQQTLLEKDHTDISGENDQAIVSDGSAGESNAQKSGNEKPLGILFPITDNGIFAALWELGEALCCGIDGQILQIPMKQSVIEICNAMRLNPYEIPSGGSGLLVTKFCRRMEEYLKKNDLPAAVIGRITAGADRVLRMEEQVRYLEAR